MNFYLNLIKVYLVPQQTKLPKYLFVFKKKNNVKLKQEINN